MTTGQHLEHTQQSTRNKGYWSGLKCPLAHLYCVNEVLPRSERDGNECLMNGWLGCIRNCVMSVVRWCQWEGGVTTAHQDPAHCQEVTQDKQRKRGVSAIAQYIGISSQYKHTDADSYCTLATSISVSLDAATCDWLLIVVNFVQWSSNGDSGWWWPFLWDCNIVNMPLSLLAATNKSLSKLQVHTILWNV